MKKKVVIIGGGFGGLNVAKALEFADVEVTLLDRMNHHLFQPLLYQVATAALSADNIASPIRDILRRQKNVQVFLEDVVKVDKGQRRVITADGKEFPYDYLVVATGARHDYFGHGEWEKDAPGLKTLSDALTLRENILVAFERAEVAESDEERAKNMRFVIIGGGPTGVEMAGAIREIAVDGMKKNFRHIEPEMAEIVLVEGLGQILPTFPKKLSEAARKSLEEMGVKVMTNSRVTNVSEEGVQIGDQFLPAKTVVWAAGNQASPLLKTMDTPLDRQGRALVQEDLSLPDFPEIFVIGDAACCKGKGGSTLPGTAPVAIQQGRFIGELIKRGIRKPFRYVDKGTMATIGHAKAVAVVWGMEISGFIAWVLWGVIHIFYLIGFHNRSFVMLHWFYLYVVGKRKVRLITRRRS